MAAVTPPQSRFAADQLARPRRVVLVTLIVLSAVGWLIVVWQARDGSGMSMSSGDMMGLDLTMGMAAPLFLAMWLAMMVAMMLPAAGPMIVLFDRIQQARRAGDQSYVPTAYFVGAYLAIWTTVGVLAFGAARGIDQLASDSDWVMAEWARLGGVLLVAAGLYQLTPIKDVCLAKCRTPMSFLMTSWRDGKIGAIQMGLMHGGYCLGCCWLLFAILLPLGVMNIAAMVVIALIVFGEKSLPGGRVLARAAAVLLVVYGAIVIASPSALPTTVG